MADVSQKYPCPKCNEDAARVYSAPMVARISAEARSSLDAEEKNKERPAVVHSVPPSRENRPTVTQNPKHYKLPRP